MGEENKEGNHFTHQMLSAKERILHNVMIELRNIQRERENFTSADNDELSDIYSDIHKGYLEVFEN